MRALEPRVLLDAAAVETAIDVAGQAAHTRLADDYAANSRAVLQASEAEGRQYIDNAPMLDDDVLEAERLSTSTTSNEIVFIDAAVPDIEQLIASLQPNVTVHVLSADSDGVEQIAGILSAGTDYSAVHIFSHGVSGALNLGDATLDMSTMGGRHAEALNTIGEALTLDGDILIYGCDFGQGEIGRLAAAKLSAATGADIAASNDLTGSESLAGDWDLEVEAGKIETVSFTAPDWNNILNGYTLEAQGDPDIGHLTGGIVGTANTFALWENAVTFDPGDGSGMQTFDLQATLVGLSSNTTVSFETTASDSATLDDFRIVVTNASAVEQTINGEDVLGAGEVTIRWSILVPGTQTFAPPGIMNILFRDIEGLGGTADTRQTVSIESAAISEYTLEQGTSLDVGLDDVGLASSGTEQGTNDPGSQVSVHWDSNSTFRVRYVTRTFVSNFDMVGNAGLSTFGTTETFQTQILDLNGSNEVGNDFEATYINGAVSGSNFDVPLSIVDLDLSVFDFDNDKLSGATIHLTNAQAGDDLNFDPAILSALGIFETRTQIPAEPAPADEITIELTSSALISNYLTALQSITYSNDLADALFDRTTDRTINISITDGVLSKTATTTIDFTEAVNTPVVGNDVYVEFEDTAIVASPFTGLLANDQDPNGDVITITGMSDSNGIALVAGPNDTLVNPTDGSGQSALTSGASISINTLDGSFTYTPAANYSGSETFSYTIKDASNFRTGFVTFDIQPVVDDVVFDVSPPSASTDEDVSSLPISVVALTPDASETQVYFAENIDDGVILTDGTNTFIAQNGTNFVNITDWDRTQLRVLPVEHSDLEVDITFVVLNEEIDGQLAVETVSVRFTFDAVADVPTLEIDRARADIDADVDLASVIRPTLVDFDGSEFLTDITISNIPVGSQIFVDGLERLISGGTVVLSEADLATLVLRPPQTGADADYVLNVTATSTELAPNGDVTTLSATTNVVALEISLNNNDNPVVAFNDSVTTFAGQRVIIDVLANDSFPDGGERISQINGDNVFSNSQVTFPNGEGVLSFDQFGRIVIDVSATFSGNITFTYQLTDIDGSFDDAQVTVAVQPRWVLSGDTGALEGNDARFDLVIEGAVPQGTSISADIALTDLTAEAADHVDLVTAINDSITDLGQTAFSFDGTTITYTAPESNYVTSYNPSGNSFSSIASTGTALSLGNDGTTLQNIGFDFLHYADTFTDLYVSANGYVTFGSPVVEPNNSSIDGTALGGVGFIAPYWDDLNSAGGSIYVETQGSVPGERLFVVEWNNVSAVNGGTQPGTFQMILFEKNGRVIINYDDMDFGGSASNGGGASIGVQSAGSVFDEFSLNSTSVASGSSITLERGFTALPTLIIDIPIIDDTQFEATETFRLNITNSVGSSIGNSQSIATIAVSDNTAPVAVDDTLSVAERTSGTINLIDPNNATTGEPGEDTDAEGHDISLTEINSTLISGTTIVVLPSGATVSANVSGVITYNPGRIFDYLATGETATDTFQYYIQDSFDGSSGVPATVTVTITGVNQAPIVDLNDSGASTNPDITVVYRPTDNEVAVADTDASVVDPDDTTFTGLNLTLGGFLQGTEERVHIADLTIPYTSPAGTFVATLGSDVYEITYDGAEAIGIVQQGGAELSQLQIDTLLRDIRYENISAADEAGTRTIEFSSADAEDLGLASTASIIVLGNNNPPVAADDFASSPVATNEETPVTISIANLLANDTDPDFGDTINLVAVSGGANGSAVQDGLGGVVFTPNVDFSGITFFEYTIADANGEQDTGRVFVNVININDAPRIDLDGSTVGLDYTFDYTENDPATPIIDASGFLTDVDNSQLVEMTVQLNGGQIGDALVLGSLPPTLTATVVPAVGPAGLVGPGTVTVTFTGNGSPSDYETALRSVGFENFSDRPNLTPRTIDVTVNDGELDSIVATTTINIIAVNDAPTTAPDGPFLINEDIPRTFNASGFIFNDTDAEDDPLQIISVQDADNGGTVTLSGTSVIYTPAANYFGPASFTYTVDDGNGGQSTETVSLTILSRNDVATVDLDANTAGTGFVNTYTEGLTPSQVVDASLSISDIDDTSLESASVVLTNGFAGDILDYGALPSGISVTVSPSVPLASDGQVTLTFSGSASIADYNTLLQTVTLSVGTDAPSEVTRAIDIFVNDGDDNSNVGRSNITVVATNDAPIASDDTITGVQEDQTRNIAVAELLGNDVDPDIEPFTIVSVQGAVNGTATLNGDGSVTFVPPANYFGPASFTYTIQDADGEQSTATASMTVASVNDVTVIDLDTNTAGSDFTTTYTEDDTLGVSLVDPTLSIFDIDNANLQSATVVLSDGQIGDALSITGSLPSGISALISPSSNLSSAQSITVTLTGTASLADYTAALQQIVYLSDSSNPTGNSTTRSVAITTNDGFDNSNTALTTVTVIPVNDAPVAVDDGPFSINEDESLSLTVADLVFNDSDPEGDAIQIVSVQSPTNGTVTLDGSGQIVFIPNANYFGPATFTYTARDALGAESTGTVNIDVVSVNDPTAVDLNANTPGDGNITSYIENGAGTLLADPTLLLIDVDNAVLQSAVFTLTNGQIGDILEVGSLPAPLSAFISPAGALTGTGQITVTISGAGTPADYATALQAVTFRSVSETPDEVVRTVNLVINDTIENSAVVTAQISVTSVNDIPVAVADGVFAFDEDTILTLTTAQLLSNDTDADNDVLDITSVQNSVNGTAVLNADGTINFTPDTAYFGPASFEYTVADGNGGTSVTVVNLDVLFVNDAPVVDLSGPGGNQNYGVTYVENDVGVVIVDTDVLITDEDHTDLNSAEVVLTNGQPGDLLEIGLLPGTMSATIVPGTGLSTTGEIRVSLMGVASLADYETALQAITFRSTSEQPDETTRSITVVVNDGFDNSSTATTFITVVSVNDAPVANDDGPISTLEDTTVTFDPVTTNDTDVENDALFITEIDGQAVTPGGSITSISGALISLDGNGVTVTFTPAPNFFGSTSFVYTVSDGALTDTATVNIEVVSVNDAPIAVDDGPLAVAEDTFVDFDPITANDSDVENDPLTVVSINGQPITVGGTINVDNGVISLGGDNRTLRFTPNADYFGPAIITYGVSDGQDVSEAEITYDVTAVDDPLILAGSPSNVAAFDAQDISIDMSAFITDVDNDAVIYVATGLPAGLTINTTTGLVSGTLASDASVTSPYTITVTVDDQVASQVDLTFVMTVTNVPPVAVGDTVVSLEDGAPFVYETSQLFNDPDGDVLTYTILGLPVWATYDAVTGTVSGTVPSDASVTGSLPATVSVDDGQGGVAMLVLTVDPQNVPPVVNVAVNDLVVSEEDAVDIDLNGRYSDGGFDADPITISVAGLPDGVEFDPTTGLISGIAELGTASVLPYVVTVTIDDGQGGIAEDIFSLRVGRDDYLDDQDVFASLDELTVLENDSEAVSASTDFGVSSLVNAIADLNGTVSLDGDSGIVLEEVNSIDPLFEATTADAAGGIVDVAENISNIMGDTLGFGQSNRDGNGDWSVGQMSHFVTGTVSDYEALTEEKNERDVAAIDDRLDRIVVTSFLRNGETYIEVNNKLDPERDGQIVQIVIGGEDGAKLPAWVRMVREGLIKAEPPVGETQLTLEMVFTLGNSNELVKTVNVDLEKGTVVDLAKPNGEVTQKPLAEQKNAGLNQIAQLEIDNTKPVEATH